MPCSEAGPHSAKTDPHSYIPTSYPVPTLLRGSYGPLTAIP
jgi:hypothetical protein